MRFEWDADKNAANEKKHGVSFETAALVFADPNHILLEDQIDEDGETRWHALGLVDVVLLLVVHVYRSTNEEEEEETIRIISARKASNQESRGYFQ